MHPDLGRMKLMAVCSVVCSVLALSACSERVGPEFADTALPGRPEITVRTKVDGQWTIVGMNNEWMLLTRKAGAPSISGVSGRIRIEHTAPLPSGKGKSILSEDQLHEVRCEEAAIRLVGIRSYELNNLAGTAVEDIENWRIADWTTPGPGSILEAAGRSICEQYGLEWLRREHHAAD